MLHKVLDYHVMSAPRNKYLTARQEALGPDERHWDTSSDTEKRRKYSTTRRTKLPEALDLDERHLAQRQARHYAKEGHWITTSGTCHYH